MFYKQLYTSQFNPQSEQKMIEFFSKIELSDFGEAERGPV